MTAAAALAASGGRAGAPSSSPAAPGVAANGARRNVPITYMSGSLTIEAYYSRPGGPGPFPMVVFNHGSRAGAERNEVTFAYMADVFGATGYATLVPERRGYGKSDGPTFSEAVGNDVGDKFVARLQQEADDVIASLSYLPMLPAVDPKRIAIAGWSLGGIVTMFAIARSKAFKVAVNEASGALTWNRSPTLQKALTEAAKAAKIPVLFLDAQNDATTDAVSTLAKAMQATGVPHELKIYPPFTPTTNPDNIAPGHLVFSAEGVPIFGKDVTAFLGKYL
jgi:dienelactone hydrolase